MKKVLFAVLAATQLLFAEAYQVNTLSARQVGMAHTGAALKLGAESMHFNPGALGYLDKTLDVSAGVTFIFPEIEFYSSDSTKGKETPKSNFNPSTPFYVYIASNILPWLSAGLSFTTPYGNAAEWNKNWEGAGLIQEISLMVFTLQPTIAIKPIEQFSIGGGPTINFGNFSLSKALVKPGAFNSYAPLAAGLAQLNPQGSAALGGFVKKYADVSAVSATLSGDADVAIGYHLGALWDVVPNKLAFGVSYRSEVEMKVAKGKTKIKNNMTEQDTATVNAVIRGYNAYLGMNAVPTLPVIPPLDKGTFEASLPLPANLNVGVSLRPTDKWLIDFDVQWTNWSAYDSLIVKFSDASGASLYSGAADQHLAKRYRNSFAHRLGAQYTVIDALDLRFGMYYDESPVKDEYLNPETPSTDKLAGSIGATYRVIPNFAIDLAFLYSTTLGKRESANKDLLGSYSVQGYVPTIGMRYSF